MKVLIWIAMSLFIPELVHGESNPYKEALDARPWQSVHGYVVVRPGAHMFYWLYYADGTKVGAESKPLIIWIPGGPGYAASGIANFAEIGPLTMNMELRNHTWVKGRNVLLLDQPVGTGFSYVTNNLLLVKTDQDMATDVFAAIQAFFDIYKGFRQTPTYLFGQSYGGKICPIVAYNLHTAIKEKRLEMNLKGIGIGSGWVDPKESMETFPNYLYIVGLIDQSTYLKATAIVKRIATYIEKGDYVTGVKLISGLLDTLNEEPGSSINFLNINQPKVDPAMDLLQTKMNTYVKPTLSHVDQNLEWKYKSADVFWNMKDSLLVPSTNYLEKLLNGTDIKVAVYNGNLDADMPIAGASNWANLLKWHGSEEFRHAKRVPILGWINGFYKEAKQLSLWWVLRSGVWVPEDNPEAMEHILEYLMP